MATLTPVKNSLKYVTELFQESDFDPRLSIADSVFDRSYNIYHFSIADLIIDTDNYWIQWGGFFDNITGFGLQIFLNQFLLEVFSTANLILIENSFYIDETNYKCYINIPRKPWQYKKAFSAVYENSNSTFSTAPRDESNLSDVYYGLVKAYPRMKVPSLNNKLNEIISGVIVYNSFSVDVNNADGIFDDIDIINYFNTPIQISKSDENPDSISDFNLIRRGIVQDIDISFDSFNIKGVDQFYLMNKDFCKKFSDSDYPNISSSDINKDIPVAWGAVKKIEPTEVDKDTGTPPEWIDYIAVDPDYIASVQNVYDENGDTLTYSFDSATGIIRVTELDGDGEVIESESMDVTGKSTNKIGQIIIDAIKENENIPYTDGLWDITETNKYLTICATVGFYFDGGTTRDLIEAVLKNDNAYLIQKHNGYLTIRQWGQVYETHTIPTYLTTQKPKKNFIDASKYFCSSVKILSDLDHLNDIYDDIYIDDTQEDDIFETYRRSFVAEFKTDLDTEADIIDLADRLLTRFGTVKETIEVGFGVDTFEINLLDSVRYECFINDNRSFAEYSTWIVKEADPGQDILVLEGDEITYLLSFDGEFAEIQNAYFEIAEGD